MNSKIITLFMAAAACSSLSAQESSGAREVNGGMDFSDVYNMGAKTSYTHWSAEFHAGGHVLNNAKDEDGNRMQIRPQVGGQLHYTFTQYWGMGFDFTWYNNNQFNYDNSIFNFGLNADVNVTNLLAPYRQWNKFNMFFNGGVGFPLKTWKNAYEYKNLKKEEDKPLKDGARFARPTLKGGSLLEYNFNEDFAIGLYGNVLMCPTRGNNNEGSLCIHPTANGGRWIVEAGLSLRYKIKAERNIRNTNIKQAEDYTLELKDQLTAINKQERRIDSLAKATTAEINEVKLENERLQEQLRRQQDSLVAMQRRVIEKTVYNPTEDESKLIKASLKDLRFETGKAVIMPVSFPSLDRLAQLIGDHKEWQVMLSGYTDNVGDEEKNLLLSRDRAAAVKVYLVNKGIPANRIQSVGYGQQMPIAPNNTPEGRAKNRRVELELFTK